MSDLKHEFCEELRKMSLMVKVRIDAENEIAGPENKRGSSDYVV